MKVLRIALLSIAAFAWGFIVLTKLGLLGGTCSGGCPFVEDPFLPWLLLPMGLLAVGLQSLALIRRDLALFRIASLVAGSGGVALIFMMIYAYHAMCSACALFDLAMTGLALTNVRNRYGKFLTIPALLLICVMQVLGLRDIALPRDAFAHTEALAVRPEEARGMERHAGILFLDPQCPHCRSILKRVRILSGPLYYRWIVRLQPIDEGRDLALAVDVLLLTDLQKADAFMTELSNRKRQLARAEILEMARQVGGENEVREALERPSTSLLRRLTQDDEDAKKLNVRDVPALFVVSSVNGGTIQVKGEAELLAAITEDVKD